MRVSRYFILTFLPILLFFSTPFSYGAFSIINGEFSDDRYLPVYSAEEHFDLSLKAYNKKEWEESLRHSLIITLNFPESAFYSEATYISACSYYYLSEFDAANKQLTKYLTLSGSAKHFEDVFEYKFLIAEQYRQGAKRHMLGYERMPKWSTGRGEALKLYDEIIASLPSRDIATRSHYSKALLLKAKGEYRESIDSLQTLLRRFPKHELTPESYVLISEIYLEQSLIEAQNPDLLALAELNFRRFKTAFPGEKRGEVVEKNLVGMKESFAESLYKTGRFYERKKKPNASYIYYADAIRRYPETQYAAKCISRLEKLGLLTDALKTHYDTKATAQK